MAKLKPRLSNLDNRTQSPYLFLESLRSRSEYADLERGRFCSFEVANNTTAIYGGPADMIFGGFWAGINYHRTRILETLWFGENDVEIVYLDSGGWRTFTTKRRLQLLLPNMIGLWSEDHVWKIRIKDEMSVDFADRISIVRSDDRLSLEQNWTVSELMEKYL